MHHLHRCCNVTRVGEDTHLKYGWHFRLFGEGQNLHIDGQGVSERTHMQCQRILLCKPSNWFNVSCFSGLKELWILFFLHLWEIVYWHAGNLKFIFKCSLKNQCRGWFHLILFPYLLLYLLNGLYCTVCWYCMFQGRREASLVGINELQCPSRSQGLLWSKVTIISSEPEGL